MTPWVTLYANRIISTAWAVLSRLKHLMKPATPLFRALPPIIIADKPINSMYPKVLPPMFHRMETIEKQYHSCRFHFRPLNQLSNETYCP